MEGVKFKGEKIQLVGNLVKVGDLAPVIRVVTKDLKEIEIGKEDLELLITVPSLDTGVCEEETKKFNSYLKDFPSLKKYVVSMDLPFAQKRFCDSFSISQVEVASDFRYKDLEKYGVLIGNSPLQGLLARTIFLIEKGRIIYRQIVPEITQEPNYEEVLEAIKKCI